MKKITAITAAAFAVAFTTSASAQSLIGNGRGIETVFQTAPGETVVGLESVNFDLYYLLQRNGASTQLLRTSSFGGPSTVLFDFGTPAFGSFIRHNAGKLYFSDSSTNALRTLTISTGVTTTLTTIGNAYDMDFTAGYGWVAANPGFAGNQILRLDLTTGATTTALTSSDFSGPVTVAPDGSLYYGATAFGAGGDIFRYTPAELLTGGLTLDAAHKWIENPGNAYFDFHDGSYIAQSDFSTVTGYNLAGIPVGQPTVWATSTDTIGHLASDNIGLLAAVTAYNGAPASDDRSTVFRIVPEPAAAALLLTAIPALARRRRRS